VHEDRIATYEATYGRVGIDAGAVLGTWGELRAGPVWQHIDAKVETGSPVLPSLKETSAGVAARLIGDHMDHAWFAREGHRTILTAYLADGALGSDRNYKRLEGAFDGARSFGTHTFSANVAAGTDLGSDMPAYEAFTLGGPLHLSAYRIGEFSGRRMAFGRVMYYNRALPLPDILGSGVYFGGSLEAGKVRNRFDTVADTDTKYSASIFLGADTFAGPAYFGLGGAPGGRYSIYLLLGVP
jgi:NTE family protein